MRKTIKITLSIIIMLVIVLLLFFAFHKTNEAESTFFSIYIENKSAVSASQVTLMIYNGENAVSSQTVPANDDSFTIVIDKSFITDENTFKISILCPSESGDFTYYDNLFLSDSDSTPMCYTINGTSTTDMILQQQ